MQMTPMAKPKQIPRLCFSSAVTQYHELSSASLTNISFFFSFFILSHPGELERDVDGEDDQAEGGEEVVEGEEEGVEGAVGGGLLPVVIHIVLHEEGGDEAAVQEIHYSHGDNH